LCRDAALASAISGFALVQMDSINPRFERPPALITPQRTIDLNERILRNVLRIIPILNEVVRNPKQFFIVFPEDDAELLFISFEDFANDIIHA
jgi:hypothetical protein